MAKRGERAVIIPVAQDAGALEGLYIAGRDDDAVAVIVAAPHPLYGGSMETPVVTEVAYAAREVGLASLRFNWRGIGGSAGAVSGEAEDADADYRAALDYLLETVPGSVCAAGYSFGAACAVRVAAAEPRIHRLLLLAPPPAFLDTAALAAFDGDVTVIAGSEDSLAPASALVAMVEELPRGRFHEIPGADHFFGIGLTEIGRISRRALAAGSDSAGNR